MTMSAEAPADAHRRFTDVAVVGGHIYPGVRRGFVTAFRDRGCFHLDDAINEINAPIGIMRRKMREWLEYRSGDLR